MTREPDCYNVEGYYFSPRTRRREWLIWMKGFDTLEDARRTKESGEKHLAGKVLGGFSKLRIVAVYYEVIE